MCIICTVVSSDATRIGLQCDIAISKCHNNPFVKVGILEPCVNSGECRLFLRLSVRRSAHQSVCMFVSLMHEFYIASWTVVDCSLVSLCSLTVEMTPLFWITTDIDIISKQWRWFSILKIHPSPAQLTTFISSSLLVPNTPRYINMVLIWYTRNIARMGSIVNYHFVNNLWDTAWNWFRTTQ